MVDVSKVLTQEQLERLNQQGKLGTIKLIWGCQRIYNRLCPKCKKHFKYYNKYCPACKGIATDILKRLL